MRTSYTKRAKWLFIFTLCFLFFLAPIHSQSTKGHLRIIVGPNLGVPFIPDAPVGSSLSPKIGLSGGFEWLQPLTEDWLISVGARYTVKRADLISPVKTQISAGSIQLPPSLPINLPDTLVTLEGELAADFSNQYLEFPITLQYKLSSWRLGVGYQYSYLLKGKAEGAARVGLDIPLPQPFTFQQPFNETENINSNESSFIFSVVKDLNEQFSVGFNGNIALTKLFDQPIQAFNNPRNMYGHLFVSVKLLGGSSVSPVEQRYYMD